jgi:hypothetical protein
VLPAKATDVSVCRVPKNSRVRDQNRCHHVDRIVLFAGTMILLSLVLVTRQPYWLLLAGFVVISSVLTGSARSQSSSRSSLPPGVAFT